MSQKDIGMSNENTTGTEGNAAGREASELSDALARITELEGELRVSAELNTLLALKLGLPGEALNEMVEMLRLPLADRIQRIMAKAG